MTVKRYKVTIEATVEGVNETDAYLRAFYLIEDGIRNKYDIQAFVTVEIEEAPNDR